jgi:hypothetical protein
VALPPAGGGHGVHDEPQVAGSALLTQALAHSWKLPGHANTHFRAVGSQVPAAPVGPPMAHSASLQQAPAAMHLSLQSLKSALHANLQVPPVQAAVALAGALHDSQAGPQLVTASAATHICPHRCLSGGQIPAQASPAARHLPAHNVVPPGQIEPQALPSQVADPPLGISQALQDKPQVACSLSLAHWPSQRCVPSGHG